MNERFEIIDTCGNFSLRKYPLFKMFTIETNKHGVSEVVYTISNELEAVLQYALITGKAISVTQCIK